MPFEERSVMMQREEFCRLASKPGANVRELCRRAGISPTSGYKWLERYRLEGVAGLADRSRRPHGSPRRTPADVEAKVLAVRDEHEAWGGRKIRKDLERTEVAGAPSPSTITQILRRSERLNGPRTDEARDWTRFEHTAPNELWQMDYKGHFALEAGRCYPLTVLDDHSRYALEIGACADQQTQTVQGRLQQLFRRHGLPRRILTDNGAPWGTAGSSEPHTLLTVWLMDLEVSVVHGRAYHPQTQGKIERFHRSLKAEVLDGRTFQGLDQAQAAFDAWRHVYNTRRPHEGIGLVTPDTRYRMSVRPMPETITPPEYAPGEIVRRVQDGRISFRSKLWRCSKAFSGRAVALRPTEADGVYDLCYRRHVLAQVDLGQNVVKSVHHVSEHVSTMSPV
jgi:transposase InsO family protein